MKRSDVVQSRPVTAQERQCVEQAQAQAVLKSMPITLLANCFIAASSAAVIYATTPTAGIPIWLALVFSMNLLRFALIPWLRRQAAQPEKARRVIHILTGTAFAGGILWSMIAFLGEGIGTDGTKGLIIFILAGISAGAMIQSSACARPPMGMAIPTLSASISGLMFEGTFAALAVVSNIALFLFMLIRASRQSEAAFTETEIGRLRAAELALSLQSANRKLERLANTDPMTGLGNRAAFNDDLAEAIDAAVHTGEPAVLVLFDLDRFKQINDTLGHTAGDTVLKTFASRLLSVTDADDHISRLGGDEFAVVLTGSNALDRATALAAIVLEVACQPIDVGGRRVSIATSIGIAHAPQQARSPKAAYECADLALYAAKQRGRQQICLFEATMSDHLERRRMVEFYLERALDHALIDVRFQPQRLLQTGRIVGYEALPVWKVPRIGLIAPGEMVEAAAALGLSQRLTWYIAERAATLAGRLRVFGQGDIPVTLNITAGEFNLYGVEAMLREVVAAAGIGPAQMVIEVPEQAVSAADHTLDRLRAIGNAGFRLAIDRFGAAQASLTHLAGLPIDHLKIDPGLLRDLGTSRDKQLVIGALVGIARALSVNLVVEGIETEDHAEALRLLGCRIGQGPLYGEPLTAGVIERIATGTPELDEFNLASH